MTTITIPAEIMRVVRSTVLTELGDAADEISQASLGFEKEQDLDSFNEPLARFDTLRRLLHAVGWSNETQSIDIEEQHREILATVLEERLVADRHHIADPLTDSAARDATEHDVYGVEDFLAATGLSG